MRTRQAVNKEASAHSQEALLSKEGHRNVSACLFLSPGKRAGLYNSAPTAEVLSLEPFRGWTITTSPTPTMLSGRLALGTRPPCCEEAQAVLGGRPMERKRSPGQQPARWPWE